MADSIPTRPSFTLPAPEAYRVREEYSKARVILEYGSGGSTVVAGDVAGATVFSVESDASWKAMMQRWFDHSPPAATVYLHHAEIGPTREWGFPKDESHWQKFIGYPFSIWEKHPEMSPDVVLIDGRFRIGCFVATLMHIRRPCTILFDDYGDRPYYHVVEQLLPRSEMIGRMAIFRAQPSVSLALSFSELVRLALDPR